jgi:hypothetical protein
MSGSTIPMDAQLSSHPVHRATALLRQALAPSPPPDPAELWDTSMFRADPGPIDLAHGPVRVNTPNDSLGTLLGLAPFEYVPIDCQSPVTVTHDVSAAETSPEDDGEEMLDDAVQVQLQGLVHAFHQRQRQASVLVACSIVAAIIMTLGGLVLLFGAIGSGQAKHEKAAMENGTSVALTLPRTALAAPALAPIRVSNTVSEGGSNEKVVLARPDRPVALGAFLPLGVARYVLLRGLPEDATLSAGRRTGVGTWMVKGEDLSGLSLTFGDDASGDYPTEIYLLDSDQGPQARRRILLRVDASPPIYSAGLALGWPTVFPAVTQADEPAKEQVEAAPTPPETTAERGQAQNLLAEGDIVTARRALAELAEHGQADAAYKLGLTYDDEVLARAGLRDIAGDMDTARGWYTRAAQAGHRSAAQRLQMIARPRAGV